MAIDIDMIHKALKVPIHLEDKKEWDALDFIVKWLIVTRGTVTQVTGMTVVIAGLLAWRDGVGGAFWLWLVMLFGLVMAHSTENLANDYIDYIRGVDDIASYRAQYGIHPLVHKFWTKQDWWRWFIASGTLATAAGVYVLFATSFSPIVIGLFIFGALMIPFYAYPLKYLGLGEILIFVNWGLVIIPGVYVILAGSNTSNLLNVALTGMIIGFGYGGFNWGKHVDKIALDKAKGVGTLPVRLGETASRYINIFTFVMPYILLLYLVFVAKYLPYTALLALLMGRFGWSIIKLLSQPKPSEAPAGYEIWPRWFSTPQLRHIRFFGMLLMLGLILDGLFLR